MASFSTGEGAWVQRLGYLRNTIRQEMIRRQLAEHVTSHMSVLDVGCGQGTQAIALARLGCCVTGVEPSPDLRSLGARQASAAGVDLELVDGSIEALDEVLDDRRFDVVCAHGLLMYLDGRRAAIATLRNRLNSTGRLSLTFRNGHALAMRPGLRRDWAAAVAAFDGNSYGE